ncbi:MAG: hypothetical protein F4230_07545 [Holophagales bacterium]|nr:hypothetical protein [Holophagales bacterium]MYF04825.1 hypothetical protein [Holophagales bacterium]MYJ26544.1 hypothetical protein [Holophagales bacterium]
MTKKTYDDVKQLLDQHDPVMALIRMTEKVIEAAKKHPDAQLPPGISSEHLYQMADYYDSRRRRLVALAEQLSALEKRT